MQWQALVKTVYKKIVCMLMNTRFPIYCGYLFRLPQMIFILLAIEIALFVLLTLYICSVLFPLFFFNVLIIFFTNITLPLPIGWPL
jgi:hypothetical protein